MNYNSVAHKSISKYGKDHVPLADCPKEVHVQKQLNYHTTEKKYKSSSLQGKAQLSAIPKYIFKP